MIRPTKPDPEFIATPYRVVVDSREQAPYSFLGIKADKAQRNLPIVVRTVVKGLKTGDYSIEGMEDRIALERKNLSDLYSTLSQGRERFRAEMERLAALECRGVIVEADWGAILQPQPRSKLNPKTVYRTIISWQHRWNIPWHLCTTRGFAERTAFRILNWFWEECEWKRKEEEKAARLQESQ